MFESELNQILHTRDASLRTAWWINMIGEHFSVQHEIRLEIHLKQRQLTRINSRQNFVSVQQRISYAYISD